MSAWTEVITTAALAPWVSVVPAFVLAWARWVGFLVCLPAFGGVSIRMRAALAILLAIVVLPATSGGGSDLAGLPALNAGFVPWLVAIAAELAVGSLLGLGVRVLFSSLQLAGELIDLQAGLAVQQVVNPLDAGEAGPATAALTWLAVAALLTAAPHAGHLALLDGMLQQFSAIPVGTTPASGLDLSLPITLVQQALTLAIRLAGPLLGALSLISMATAWLGRTAPTLPAGPLVAPVRIAVSIAFMAASIPAITDTLARQLDTALRAVTH